MKSTYRLEILYFALSLVAVHAVYLDSESQWISIIFFIILIVFGIIYAYLYRVNQVEIHENHVVLIKYRRVLYIKNGDVKKIVRLPIGNGVFHIWFANGTKNVFIEPLAYKGKDLKIIENHLKKMIN